MQKKLDDPVNMDDTWKHELMLLENRILRARDRVQLMDMYATAGMDILGQFMEGESVTEDKVKSIYTQFGALYKYVEKSNKEFSRAYSTKEIKIQPWNKNWANIYFLRMYVSTHVFYSANFQFFTSYS